jgi:hypothetical protein
LLVFKRIALCWPLLLGFACSQGVEPVSTSNSNNLAGTFLVDLVSGSAQESDSDSTFTSVASARLFYFKACLKDVGALQPVTGASFRLLAQGQALPLQSSTPDQNGCLFWSERLTFESTNPETFFSLEREIQAVSIHKGSVVIPIALNPWRAGSEGVRDLRFESTPKIMDSALRSQTLTNENALSIEQLGVELELVRSAQSVANGQLKIRFEPKLKRKGIDGKVILEPISSGSFSVRVQILAVAPNETRLLSSPVTLPKVTFRDGVAWAEGSVELLQRIPREYLLELAFEAIPINGPAALGPVKGRLPLGRLSALSIKVSGPLRPDVSPFPSEKPGDMPKENNTLGFQLGEVKARNLTVVALDSTGRPKRLEVEFFACFRNAISFDPILEQKFRIRMRNKETDITTNSESGCGFWRDTFDFDFYARETYTPIQIEVSALSTFYEGQSVQKSLYLNLQRYEDLSQLLLDQDFHGTPAPSLADSGASAELTVANAGFNFLNREFSIDSMLNLSTIRTYRFELRPEIRRLSRNRGWLPPLGTGNGKYRVRILLETYSDSRPTVLDFQELMVESINNVLMSTIDFKIQDLRQVGPRLLVTFQVLPLENDSSLRSLPYSGSFDLLRGFIVRLGPRNIDMNERIASFQNTQRQITKDAVEVFAKDRKHIQVDERLTSQLKIEPREIQDFFQGRTDPLLKRFCSQFFNPSGFWSPHRSCLVNPGLYMNFGLTEHLQEVNNASMARPPEALMLTMSAGLSLSNSESEDESQASSRSIAVESGARISLPIVKMLGLDFGFGVGMQQSWSTTKSYSKGRSRSRSRSADIGKQISVDQVSFQISGTAINCATIGSMIPRPADRKTFLICNPQSQQKKFQESYFFLYQAVTDSAAIDGGATLEERPFVALIRGQNRFDAFARVIKDPESTLRIDRSLPAPSELMEAYQNRFDGLFPGLLTPKD